MKRYVAKAVKAVDFGRKRKARMRAHRASTREQRAAAGRRARDTWRKLLGKKWKAR